MRIGRPSSTIHNDWNSLLSSFKKYVKKDDTVLEIGASVYERTKDLAPYCKKIIGVELFPERIPKKKESGKIKYIRGDWQKLTKILPKNSIDIAVNNQVLEHVHNDVKALDELYTVLKPGGIVLMCTPNRTRLLQWIQDKIKGERKFPWAEHVREYTKEDVYVLVKKIKFKKVHIFAHTFGIHAGPLYAYFERVPAFFEKKANFLEIHLVK